MRTVNEGEEIIQAELLDKLSATCSELETRDTELCRHRMEA